MPRSPKHPASPTSRRRRRALGAAALLATLALTACFVWVWGFTAYAPAVARSERFVLRARGGDPAQHAAILAQAEAVRDEVARDFGGDVPGPVTILAVRERSLKGRSGHAFAGFARVWPFGDCIVLHEDNTFIHPRYGVGLPEVLVVHSASDLAADRWRISLTLLRHEVVHAFVAQRMGDPPLWLHEGLAYYLADGRETGFTPSEVSNLARHAELLDPDRLLALVSAKDPFSPKGAALDFRLGGSISADPRAEHGEARVYEPPSTHTVSKLLVASLEAAEWPVLLRDPTPRILAHPDAVIAHARAFASTTFWQRYLANRPPWEAMSRERRAAIAEGLGRSAWEGARGILLSLIEDHDAAVRDRAALSLFRLGDRRFAAWVVEAHAALVARLRDAETLSYGDAGFATDIEEAVAAITDARDLEGIARALRERPLADQIPRPPSTQPPASSPSSGEALTPPPGTD